MDVGTKGEVLQAAESDALKLHKVGSRWGRKQGTFTHKVRIFGMWLKLVTRMRLMLLLLRVLRRERRNRSTGQQCGRYQDAYGRWGRDGCDCKRDHQSTAMGQLVQQPETSLQMIRESLIPFPSGFLLSSAALSVLTYLPGAISLPPEILLCSECFVTTSLIPTTTTPVTYSCPHFREKETDTKHLA